MPGCCVDRTGLDLHELVAMALGRPPGEVRRACAGRKVGVVPVSAGEGVIPGFDAALASIALRMSMLPNIPSPRRGGLCAGRAGRHYPLGRR